MKASRDGLEMERSTFYERENMFWSKNKQLGSEEYEKVLKRMATVESTVAVLDSRIQTLNTNVNSLRGLVNRALSDEDDDDEDTENVNNSGMPIAIEDIIQKQ